MRKKIASLGFFFGVAAGFVLLAAVAVAVAVALVNLGKPTI